MAQVHGYKTKVELWSISRRYVVDTICFCLIFIFIFLFFYFFIFFHCLFSITIGKGKWKMGGLYSRISRHRRRDYFNTIIRFGRGGLVLDS